MNNLQLATGNDNVYMLWCVCAVCLLCALEGKVAQFSLHYTTRHDHIVLILISDSTFS